MGSKAVALKGKWELQGKSSKKQLKSKEGEMKRLPERIQGEGPFPLVQE
jgi:hypothetical protein